MTKTKNAAWAERVLLALAKQDDYPKDVLFSIPEDIEKTILFFLHKSNIMWTKKAKYFMMYYGFNDAGHEKAPMTYQAIANKESTTINAVSGAVRMAETELRRYYHAGCMSCSWKTIMDIQEHPEKYPEKSVLHLNLENKTLNPLQRGGVKTIGQLLKKIQDESLNEIRNIGSVALNELNCWYLKSNDHSSLSIDSTAVELAKDGKFLKLAELLETANKNDTSLKSEETRTLIWHMLEDNELQIRRCVNALFIDGEA